LKDEHRHQILIDEEWKDLIGISSVVKILTNFSQAAYYGSRRALMGLGYDPKDAPEALKGFRNEVNRILTLNPEEQQKALKSAYTAHAKYAKDRAKKGTDSHEILNKWAQKCIEENEGKFLTTGSFLADEPKVQKFLELAIPHIGKDARIIASEKKSYSEELWLAGITDLIVETADGKIVILDFKDRPVIYENDLLQMGGYSFLFPTPISFVLGVPLEGKEARPWFAVDKLQEAFKGLLTAYKFLNQFK